MKNFKILIRYDGSCYDGWQRLKDNDNTIQGKIEDVLSKMTNTKIEIIGSGRTDKGVHAAMQVANFHAQTDKTADEVLSYLNRYLPKDIGVYQVEEVDERFHSRFNAKEKTYQYRIWNSPIHNVFERKYLYTIEQTLDLEKMQSAAKQFIGTHDFLAFSSLKKVKKSTVRTLTNVEVNKSGSEIVITMTGDGFLYNMARIIAGTIVEVGLGNMQAIEIDAIFESKVRANAGITLPAEGLVLKCVKY